MQLARIHTALWRRIFGSCIALCLQAQTGSASSSDSQQALDWLFSQPYFRDVASSFPDGAELFSEGASPDEKLPGFYKAEVRAFISTNAAGTTHIGDFRFSPSDKMIKKKDPDTGYYTDVYLLPKEPDQKSSPIVDFFVAVAQGPPAAPSSTPARQNDNRANERAAPTATPKPQPMYGVRMDGNSVVCFNLESGSTVTKVRAPTGVVVGGPSFSGDRAVVTVQKGNVRTTHIYRMPSMSTVTRTSSVQREELPR